jgi:class 3 adenylate cyclase
MLGAARAAREIAVRAWTVDADDIRVAEDFDESLLHRTPEIDSFLNPDRDDKFIVIGTKGFGKTLLLKAKRILYQREARAACLPVGNLLDKPIGDKIFGRESLTFLAAAPLPWSKIWLAAIALATLKHLGAAAGLRIDPRLASLVADEQLRSVIDHFVRLLDFTPSELQRCGTDTDGHLVPRLRAVKSPVAIFIDGVDEYFTKHVEGPTAHPSVTGELSPNVWHFAQLGLVEVAYQLRRINHHIKVFAAVRKEAYARLPQTTVMAQQYRGSAVDIAYSVPSLREIFINNIRLLKSDAMVEPERWRADPLAAFLGRTAVTDPYTGEREDAFAYIGRHTLLRPRDLMTIGERLAALRPDERRSELRMKEVVHQAATEIAYEYLAEIGPHLGDLDLEQLLGRIPGHVLTRDEVESLFLEHSVATGGEEKHVFCALFRVGLLGHVHHDRVRGEWVQRFLRPGEATLDPDGVLPRATHYLLHPVLSDVIGRLNPAYLERVDRVNIAGYGRPWRAGEGGASPVSTHAFCVLKGDVSGFGGLMHARADGPVRRALDDAVRRWTRGAAVAETGAGDSVLIAHHDPVTLAQAARHIMDEVYQAPGHPRLRMALHYGEVQMREGADPPVVVGGDAILWVTRVEPYVLPGQIWATEVFQQHLAQRPSLWRTTLVPPPDGGDRFNVKKEGGTEPDLWVRLYRLEF